MHRCTPTECACSDSRATYLVSGVAAAARRKETLLPRYSVDYIVDVLGMGTKVKHPHHGFYYKP